MNWPTEQGEFQLGNFPLQSGEVLRDAKLVWKSYGTLNTARDNVILYPCSYGAKHSDMEWLIGPDGILDPTRWFIIIPNMFSNGLSSGAGNTPDYPLVVTSWDNVTAQRRLLLEQFGIERLHAVYGFSMGGQQAYHWAAMFPDAVERAIVVCSSARPRCITRFSSPACCALSRRRLSISAMAGSPRRRSARSRHGPYLCRLGAEPGFLP